MAVTVTPSGAACGAEVSGFDIADLSETEFAEIERKGWSAEETTKSMIDPPITTGL